MRRTLGVLLMVMALAGLCQAAVYMDDFDSYVPGSLSGINGWETAAGAYPVERVLLGELENQALRMASATGSQGLFKNITTVIPGGVPNDATGKISYTYRFKVPAGATPNNSIGLSHLATNTIGTDFNSFKIQVRVSRNGDTAGATLRLDFRNGGAFSYANAGQTIDIIANTWYQVWVDVDNSTDKYEVYVQGGAQATKTKLTPAGGAFFRGASATVPFTGSLVSFISLGNTVAYHVDDLVIGNALERAHNPVPAHRTIKLAPSAVTLSFNGGEDPAVAGQINPSVNSRYLYLTTGDPNKVSWTGVVPIKLTDTTDPFDYGPMSLERDKTYYWYIKEVTTPGAGATDPNALVGPVWRFETEKSIPVIKTNPVDTRAFPAASAQFQIQFESLSAPTVAWKKYVDGTNDTTLTAGAKYTIVTAFDSALGRYVSTLTVGDVALSDFGQYFAVANNSANSPQPSTMAWLGIKQLLARYAFDGNANDSVGINHGTARSVDPNAVPIPGYVDGYKAGSQAISLDGTMQYVELLSTSYPKIGYDNGLIAGTITGWLKATKNGVVLGNADINPTHFAVELHDNSDVRIIVRSATNTFETRGRPATNFSMINDGKWHFFAASWSQSDTMAIYVDGIQCNKINAGIFGAFQEWTFPILFGAGRVSPERVTLNNFYGGGIDEVKIFNYSHTREEIAQAYFDETGIGTCLADTYSNQYDFNKDCIIDLKDLATFVTQWLGCGMYPASTCK